MSGTEEEGRFAYDGLDRVLHEKARLSILTSLLTHPEGLLFAELKALCDLTDGNLSRHLQVLYQAELIEMWKGFDKKRPQTLCRLTEHGRQRFVEYLQELERVIQDATHTAAEGTPAPLPPGWMPA